MPVQCTCSMCGKALLRTAADVKAYRNLYCDLKCRSASYRVDLTTRFWRFVDQNGPVPVDTPHLGECWLWTGGLTPSGYGSIGIDHHHTQGAHRLSWTLNVGPIPDRHQVQHLCNVRRCVRPSHLEIGTPRQNTAYMFKCGRQAPPPKPKGDHRGGGHPMAKLTESAVREIRRRYAEKPSLKQLALEYGVSDTHILRIVRRQVWGHLPA